MKEEKEIQEAVDLEKKNNVMTDGSILELAKEPKGRDIRIAQNMCGGDSSLLLYALGSQCCTVDGKKFKMEDVDNWPAKDALKLITIVGEFLT